MDVITLNVVFYNLPGVTEQLYQDLTIYDVCMLTSMCVHTFIHVHAHTCLCVCMCVVEITRSINEHLKSLKLW